MTEPLRIRIGETITFGDDAGTPAFAGEVRFYWGGSERATLGLFGPDGQIMIAVIDHTGALIGPLRPLGTPEIAQARRFAGAILAGQQIRVPVSQLENCLAEALVALSPAPAAAPPLAPTGGG